MNKVKTTGQAEPEVLRSNVNVRSTAVPVWSPTGEWILHYDNGFELLSPDGKTTREVTSPGVLVFAFSPDGKTLYGMRQVAKRIQLFSVSVRGPERILGWLGFEYLPGGPPEPSLRLSFAPDGKSITFSIHKLSDTLWLMEGLTVPKPGPADSPPFRGQVRLAGRGR